MRLERDTTESWRVTGMSQLVTGQVIMLVLSETYLTFFMHGHRGLILSVAFESIQIEL